MGTQPWAFAVDERVGPTTAERTLVRAGQAGDREALDQLLALHEREVLAACRGILANAEDAEDAAQETLYRALRSLSRFRGDSSFRTWLLRIAVNVSLNWKRDRRPSEPWEADTAGLPHDPSPEAIVLLRFQVQEVLQSLPPERRAMLLLREVEGWSVEEIGTAMGWNTKRVYNELFKARRAVAEWQARHAEEGAEP